MLRLFSTLDYFLPRKFINVEKKEDVLPAAVVDVFNNLTQLSSSSDVLAPFNNVKIMSRYSRENITVPGLPQPPERNAVEAVMSVIKSPQRVFRQRYSR